MHQERFVFIHLKTPCACTTALCPSHFYAALLQNCSSESVCSTKQTIKSQVSLEKQTNLCNSVYRWIWFFDNAKPRRGATIVETMFISSRLHAMHISAVSLCNGKNMHFAGPQEFRFHCFSLVTRLGSHWLLVTSCPTRLQQTSASFYVPKRRQKLQQECC